MSQKRRNDRFRRTLSVEALEDRTLLSGNVIAGQISLLFGNHLIILDDAGNNNFSINLVSDGGVPNIRVQGAPFSPSNPFAATGVNGTTGGFIDTPLGSVNEIDINNPAVLGTPGNVTGNNTINIGNTAGFSIPGNFIMAFGPGHNVISMNRVGTNLFQFTSTDTSGTHGSAGDTGSDTVTVMNSLHGADVINAGMGTDSITLQGLTSGIVGVTTPGPKNSVVNVNNNSTAPPPRTAAIGVLTVIMGANSGTGSGNETFTMTGTSSAPTSVGLANVKLGDNTAGSHGSDTVTISNAIVSAAGLTLDVLNGSGLNNGTGDAVPSHVTINNVNFNPGHGNLDVVMDDSSATTTKVQGSTLSETGVDNTTDNFAELGLSFNSITFGNAASGPLVNDLDTDHAELEVFGGADSVSINVNATHALNVVIDQSSLATTGSKDVDTINMVGNAGSNANVFVGDDWTLNVSSEKVGGNLLINPVVTAFPVGLPAPAFTPTSFPGDGDNISVVGATVGGLLLVNEGTNNNAVNTESVTIGAKGAAVTTNDLDIEIASTNLSGFDAFFDAFLTVTNTTVKDTNSGSLAAGAFGAVVSDSGSGNDLVVLGGAGAVGDPLGVGGGPLTVASGLAVTLTAGINVALAENVSTLFGEIVNGGNPSSNFIGVSPIYGNINIIAIGFGTTA